MIGMLAFLLVAALYLGTWLALFVPDEHDRHTMPADRRTRDEWRDGSP